MTPAQTDHEAAVFHKDPHLIAGRYRMRSRIGQGRLGEIFAATDERSEELGIEQQVAIQLIPDSIVRNNTLFNKINMGYTLLRAANHPNIVRLLQFGRDARFGFLAMELLDGASFRRVLDESGTLPPDEAKTVIRGIGAALALLHAKDMVHGNLTTRNVFIGDNLEARLLDIVPLDSAEGIFRGTAMSAPFSRCTVEDDVFALACLTYEMLAGKHPFNYSTPAEARLAGIAAERIDALTEREWNALRLALSCDRTERTSSVTEFMRDFGITGTERLRPGSDQETVYEHIEYAAEEDSSQTPEPEFAARPVETAAPFAAVDSMSWNEDLRFDTRTARRQPRSIRMALLGLLLACVTAWAYLGESEEHLVSLIGYLDKNLDLGLTLQRGDIVELATIDADQSRATEAVTPPGQADAAAQAADAEEPLQEIQLPQLERRSTGEELVAAAAEPAGQAVPATQIENDGAADDSNRATSDVAEKVAPDADIAATQAEAELIPSESFVTVSERDGAARIAPQIPQNFSAQLLWWTSAQTATADEDFIAVQLQDVTNASSEDGILLHVPLVNDSFAEPQESFFVYVGFRNAEQGQIERIATVRVNIIDDDSG
jgi:serine/threonine protein kinase